MATTALDYITHWLRFGIQFEISFMASIIVVYHTHYSNK